MIRLMHRVAAVHHATYNNKKSKLLSYYSPGFGSDVSATLAVAVAPHGTNEVTLPFPPPVSWLIHVPVAPLKLHFKL